MYVISSRTRVRVYANLMPRPRLSDRDAVADSTLSVRLTALERARWDALVAKRAAELRGTGGRVTAASLARDILVAHLDAAGITAADVPPPEPVQGALPIDAPARPATTPSVSATAETTSLEVQPYACAAAAETATPAPPTTHVVPDIAATSLEVQPSSSVAAAETKGAGSFWYGIGLVAGAVETLHPRSGTRNEVEQTCRELGVELRGPFPTRSTAWETLEHEHEALEKRATAPTPPPPAPAPSAPPSPAESTAAPPMPSAPVTRTAAKKKAKVTARTAPSKRGAKSSTKKKRAR